MELRVLRYFLAVVREQNITAAAERLHVTQPTLSKQLMDLEAELGRTLFLRGNRKITLTEDGEYLRQRAQEIVDLTDKTESAFRVREEKIAGDVYIGCGETDGMRMLVKAMQRLNAECPDVRFHLSSGNGEDVAERLEKGLVDFGLFVGNYNLGKFDYFKLPVSDVWGLLMRKDDPLAARETIRPQDLERTTLLCSRQALTNNELSGWLGKDFAQLRIFSTHNLLYNATIMVEEGLGCALSIDKLYSAERNLTFRPFEPSVKADLTFAWKKHRVFSKAAEKYLQVLQQLLTER